MVATIELSSDSKHNAAFHDPEPPKRRKFNSKQWLHKQKRKMSTRAYWEKRLPIIGWLSGYNTAFFVSDLIAGITVGLTVIPQGMACAVIAGLPPQYGLYSGFMGCFVYFFLGTSKDITIGPTAISAMLVKPYADKFGPDVAILICFLSGCLITLMGIFRLGFVVDFISMPVIAGFMSAGAISIASGQVASLLGIPSEGSEFLHYWKNVIGHIEETKLWDSVLGFSCIAFLLVFRYCSRFGSLANRTIVSSSEKFWRGTVRYLSLGRNALVVLISTIIIASLIEDGIAPVQITGPVEEGFPDIGFPSFIVVYNNETLTFKEAFAELSSATIIPFILILESIAIAKAFAKGKTIDATQELLSLGLSNLLGSFFQSFPVTGSFTRTAVNNASGVKTPVGGIYTGTMVLLCLAFLTQYLQYIPKATLAAVIICAVIFMVELHEATMSLWRSKRLDLIPLYVTFIGCLLISLDIGIVIGVIVNICFILYEAARPKLKIEKFKLSSQEVMMVTPDRSITYPAAEYVKEVITKASTTTTPGLLIIVNGQSIHNIDATAIKVLKSLLDILEFKKQPILFWNWNRQLASIFIGFDTKNSEVFRHCNTIEQLLENDSHTEVEGIDEELLPPVPWSSNNV